MASDTSLVFNILAKDKASKTFDKIKVAAAAAFAVGAAAAVGFGKAAIEAGAGLEAAMGATNQVFGSAAQAMLDWSKTTASALGIARADALAAGKDFGAFFTAIGVAPQAAAKLSQEWVTMSANMAAFRDVNPTQALEAMQSALRGEMDPIQQFIPSLSAAAVEAKAMSMGLVQATKDTDKIKAAQLSAEVAMSKYNEAVRKHGKGSTEAMTAEAALIRAQSALTKATEGNIPPLTDQQKALALNALFMESTANQAGAAELAQNGFGVQSAKVTAQLKDATAEIGQKLLPVALQLTNWALGAINWMKEHETLVRNVAIGLGVFGAAIGTVLAVTKVWHGIMLLVNAAGKAKLVWMAAVRVGTLLWTGAQWLLNAALLANPIVLIVAGIILLIGIIILIATKTTWFQDIWKAVWGAIKAAAKAVGDWFTNTLWPGIQKVWDGIVNGVKGAWHWIQDTFNRVVNFVKGLPGKISSAASGMWDGIKNAFKSAINWLINKWNNFQLTLGGGSVLGIDIPSITLRTPNIPLLASGGTVLQSGLAVIHRGETVQPAQVSRSRGNDGPVVLEIKSGGSAFDDALVEILRKAVRVRGGDVQLVLGRG